MKDIILTTAKVTAALGVTLYSIGTKEKLGSYLHENKKTMLKAGDKQIHVVEAVKAVGNKPTGSTATLKETVKEQFNSMVNTATIGAVVTTEHAVKTSQRNQMNTLYGQTARLLEDTKQKYKK